RPSASPALAMTASPCASLPRRWAAAPRRRTATSRTRTTSWPRCAPRPSPSFSDTLEKARAGATDAADRGRLVSEAYLAFALKNPHAYRIMFEIDAPVDDKHPELGPAAERAARYITRGAEEMAAGGVIDVDTNVCVWA